MFKLKDNFGYIIFYFLSFFPILLWLLAKPIELRFFDAYSAITSLGQISGLVGMSMFALNFVLASRLKFLEDYFAGMNRVYIAHRNFGMISFILLLLHPLTLVARLVPFSINSAAVFLIPTPNNWPLTFGSISLLGMMLFLSLIFYTRLPYPILKFSHKLIGLSFFFAGIHTFFIPSDVSQFLLLKLYMIALVSLGTSFFIYRSILGKFLIEKVNYFVEEVVQLNEGVVEISLKPAENAICFLPGQFVFISFYDSKIGFESHPFSISSSCWDNKLKLTIKSLGDYTAKLKDLPVGTRAEIEGPFGRFYNPAEIKSQIWIAGGVGITPFLSMAESLNGSNADVDLFYVVKSREECVRLDKLQRISQSREKFRLFPYFTEARGRITAREIAKISGDLYSKVIYLCGPGPMMQNLKSQFLELKISEKNIRSEEFSFL